MKTVAKIDPEKEYENAKGIIDLASMARLDVTNVKSLRDSVDNLITAARVLMDREEQRRGRKNPPPKESKPKGRKKGQSRQDLKKIPSERYPNIEVKEEIVTLSEAPKCPCCNEEMKESGLFDTSEKLEVIPKRYYILRTRRPKFNCSHCYGGLINTPARSSIIPTSNYGDSLIIDVALSKYCDLIPIERYVQMSFRDGLETLPAQSLIGLTHHLANFLLLIYEKIKSEILQSWVVLGDETPHKMLEGDSRKNWYLWGFFSSTACYFESHNTRSGDVILNFLKGSIAKYLVSDGYPGYGKAVRILKEDENREVIEVHCNAHAYRYFKNAASPWENEVKPIIDLYKKIYELERKRQELEHTDGTSSYKQFCMRAEMAPLFQTIKNNCEELKENVMPESSLSDAINYFLNHYNGLTLCTTLIDIPLDNNLSERELRSPVVGRKTWLGTHSKRGAQTCAVLFSIVQSCKINNVNPRSYFPWIVKQVHQRKKILTPYEYSKLQLSG